MKLQELFHLIGLQDEIIDKVRLISEEMDSSQIQPYLEQMTERKTAAAAYRELDVLLGDDPDHIKMLCCQLECARRVYDRYRQMGISQTIYADTMKCFTRFVSECDAKNGRMFFDRGWWTYRQISMSLFRVGALEYEFVEEKGEKVISLHIPSDADISRESVDRSLVEAAEFFKTYYPDYRYDKYICDSWLLAPVLKQLLPAESNIVSFQDRFTITEVDEEGREFVEWLFQVPVDTAYQDLPERTSLQKKVKALLLEGGKVGAAYGIIKNSNKIEIFS